MNYIFNVCLICPGKTEVQRSTVNDQKGTVSSTQPAGSAFNRQAAQEGCLVSTEALTGGYRSRKLPIEEQTGNCLTVLLKICEHI